MRGVWSFIIVYTAESQISKSYLCTADSDDDDVHNVIDDNREREGERERERERGVC